MLQRFLKSIGVQVRHPLQSQVATLVVSEPPPFFAVQFFEDSILQPEVKRWLARHPRFHMHFTPTSSSCLNLVERWFRDLTQKRLRRGTFQSVRQLQQAIFDYVEQHNDRAQGYLWKALPDVILAKVRRARAVLDNSPTT